MKNVSFTGYRPEKFPFPLIEGDADYDAFYNDLTFAIKSVIESGTNFYCGGAMGFDIIAGEIVLKLKEENPTINLNMAVPFFEQASNFTPLWRERYKNLIKNAKKVIYLEKVYTNGCYHKRNRYLVDMADCLITYYNGKSGGTKYTINYATQKGLKVINICK